MTDTEISGGISVGNDYYTPLLFDEPGYENNHLFDNFKGNSSAIGDLYNSNNLAIESYFQNQNIKSNTLPDQPFSGNRAIRNPVNFVGNKVNNANKTFKKEFFENPDKDTQILLIIIFFFMVIIVLSHCRNAELQKLLIIAMSQNRVQ